jgi:hypothetical protein
MYLCTFVNEEGGDGEVGRVFWGCVGQPMYLCTCVHEEVGDREEAGEGGDVSIVL